MAKRFNMQDFTVALKSGGTITIECSSVRYWDHTSQRAEVTQYIKRENRWYWVHYKGYSQYINRPWESFDYETAISALAKNFENSGEKEIAADIREWSRKHAKGEAEAAEKFVSNFKKEWDAARPSLREAVAAGGPIESEEQAKSTLALLKMGNFLNSLG